MCPILTKIRKTGVVSRWHRLLVMNTDRFALGYRTKSVSVAFTSAIHEVSTDATGRIVVIFLEGASTLARIRWCIASIYKKIQYCAFLTHPLVKESLKILTLPLEFSTKTFALFLGLESIRVSFTTTVDECLTHLAVCVIIIGSDVTVAGTRIGWRVTNGTL